MISMPDWNDLTDAERQTIVKSVAHDDVWDAKIAIDVYQETRRVLGERMEKWQRDAEAKGMLCRNPAPHAAAPACAPNSFIIVKSK